MVKAIGTRAEKKTKSGCSCMLKLTTALLISTRTAQDWTHQHLVIDKEMLWEDSLLPKDLTIHGY